MTHFHGFISFEGIDFSGKSTQIKLLQQRLEADGIKADLLREPGGTAISEQIRQVLLSTKNADMTSSAEILLYSAARAQLVEQVIIPSLQKGAYLIADRFFDSTTAYQGYGRGLDLPFVQQLNHFATSGLQPFRTIFVDVKPQTAMERRQLAERSNDRLEAEDLEFYQRVYDGYHQIAAANQQRFIIVDGENSSETVAEDIYKSIRNFWPIR